MAKYNFIQTLKNSKSEEEVKQAYIREFKIDATIRDAVDLRTENVLFEFKHKRPFADNGNAKMNRMKTLAQALYYVHRCKFGDNKNSIPNQIIIAEHEWAVVYITDEWKKIYTDTTSFDWSRSPSTPDPMLVQACMEHEFITSVDDAIITQLNQSEQLNLFHETLTAYIEADTTPTDRKIVTEANFESVYEHWKSVIGKYIDEEHLAKYFIEDLDLNNSFYDKNKNMLIITSDVVNDHKFKVPSKSYLHFWNVYYRRPLAKVMESIRAKADRLNNMEKRRFNGEFYTPLEFAQKGLDYIAKELGDNWFNEYKIWDMACGTGNLEYNIPNYDNVFMSTLDDDEVVHLNNSNVFNGATIFQYDYLNDDVDLVMNPIPSDLMGEDYVALLDDSLGWKLPRKLREELANPDNKWVVLMNPPYGTGSSGVGTNKKAGTTFTKVREHMLAQNIGSGAVQELFSQFIYRVTHELPNSFMGIYAPLKYVNAPNHKMFRDLVFHAEFKNGFIFPSWVFKGTTGKWPVSFLTWDLSTQTHLLNQIINIHIYDENSNHSGNKEITVSIPKDGLNKWCPRPKNTVYAPPLKSALSLSTTNASLNKLADNAIGYILCNSNSVQQQQLTAIVSSAHGDGHGWSITPEIFEKTMIISTIRRLVKDSWSNHNDQFKQPNTQLSQLFTNNCVIWSLFSGKNQSSSLKDVEYKGNTYQIKNEFYPFNIKQVEQWETQNNVSKESERFVATWIDNNTLSKEAQAVYDVAREIYALYYSEINNLNHIKFKLDNFDAGWYQIRNALKDAELGKELFNKLAIKYNILTNKLQPAVYEYGFLDREELF